MPYVVSHGGGDADSVEVNEASTIVLPASTLRKYAIVVASRNNSGPIYLKLSPQNPIVDDEAEPDKGIPLYPGDAYEIVDNNLFQGNILAIKPLGAGTHIVLVQEGR